MKTFLIKNWKTTAIGVAMATVAFLKVKNVIDGDTVTYVLAVLGALGFAASKDADKSGL